MIFPDGNQTGSDPPTVHLIESVDRCTGRMVKSGIFLACVEGRENGEWDCCCVLRRRDHGEERARCSLRLGDHGLGPCLVLRKPTR